MRKTKPNTPAAIARNQKPDNSAEDISVIRRVSSKDKLQVIDKQDFPSKIQSALISVFDDYKYGSLDLEALIFLCLQRFAISAHSYEDVYKMVRQHIFNNFSVAPGKLLTREEINVRRITVLFTSEEKRSQRNKKFDK